MRTWSSTAGIPPAGKSFTDKIRALREAQRGFSSDLTRKIAAGSVETMREIKDDLTAIVDGYSTRPNIIKYLARISHTDYTTAVHSINVMALTLGYCFYTGRNERDSAEYGLAAPRKPTDEKFEQMKRHPTSAAEILSEYGDAMTTALEAALHHHLKLDGSGYPDGTPGAVSEIGRIISVVDTYEALTNDDRPSVRTAARWLPSTRFAYSLTESGTQRPKQTKPGVARPEIGQIVGDG